MGRGQIGDSKSDKAYARMEKAMAKSVKKRTQKLKAIYSEKMRRG